MTQKLDQIRSAVQAVEAAVKGGGGANPVVATLGQIKIVLEQIRDKIAIQQKQGDDIKELADNANNPGSIYTHDVNLESFMRDKVLPHIETVAAVIEEAKPTVSMGDFDAQVQSRVQQSRPSPQMQAATDYLIEIAANTAASVDELKEVVKTLSGIRDMLSSLGEGGGGVDTKGDKKPRGTPNFYQWQFGRFGDTSAKQYINSGV
jgi:hypothetical protein